MVECSVLTTFDHTIIIIMHVNTVGMPHLHYFTEVV